MFARHMVVRLGLSAAAAVVLASCASQPANWSGAESPKANRVDWVQLEHAVRFTPAENELSPAEKHKLAQFLARSEIGYGDRLFVTAGASRLASERKAKVREFLSGAGYESIALTDDDRSGRVAVVVGRYVVTPPACPDWRKRADDDRGNTNFSNFGCATAVNLGLMVADPGDLVRGRRMGPAEGEFAARAIERYRKGEITPLNAEDTAGDEAK